MENKLFDIKRHKKTYKTKNLRKVQMICVLDMFFPFLMIFQKNIFFKFQTANKQDGSAFCYYVLNGQICLQ